MATKQSYPTVIHSTTWNNNYQEVSGLNIDWKPNDKGWGIARRMYGVTPMQILEKATHILLPGADISNGLIPIEKTWITGRSIGLNMYFGDLTKDYSGGTINPGDTFVTEITGIPDFTTDNFLTSFDKYYIKNSGGNLYFGGQLNVTIPSNGTVRFALTNGSSSPLVLPDGRFFVKAFNTPRVIAVSFVNYGIRAGSAVWAEFIENGVPDNKVKEIFRQTFIRLQDIHGSGLTVNDTRIYSDYFTPTLEVDLFNEPLERLITRFSSQDSARKFYRDGNWHYLDYYANNEHTFSHRYVGGYYDGIRRMFNCAGVFRNLISIELCHVAMDTRKVGVFGWGSFEGVGEGIERRGTWQRLPWANPSGDIIRLSRPEGSFAMTLDQGFYTFLAGNDFDMWAGNDPFLSTDIRNWDKAFIGGADAWKTLFQPTGGVESQYSESNPTQPVRQGCLAGCWAESALPTQNGAFIAAWYYNLIKDRVDTLVYASFNYSIDGVTYNGYYDGNTPRMGVRGDASVSRMNNGNAGQDNAARQYNAKKPIVMRGSGSQGRCLIVHFPHADILDNTTFNISTEIGTQTVTQSGTNLAIYFY